MAASYAPPRPAARPGLPWERAKSLGSLLATAKLLITAPHEAFAQAREKGDYLSPLLFALFFGLVGGVFAIAWSLLLRTITPGAGTRPPGFEESLAGMPPRMQALMEAMMSFGEMASSPKVIVAQLLAAPILMPIVLFVFAAVIHLGLRLAGGLGDSTAGYEGSFRVYAYAQVAALGNVVPMAGVYVALAWTVILTYMGLASIHRTSSGKAVVGALSPVIVSCTCTGIVVVTILVMIVAAMTQ